MAVPGQLLPLGALARMAGLRRLPDNPVSAWLCRRTAVQQWSLGRSGGPTVRQGRSSQSEFDLFGDAESVVDLDPEVADGALQLRVPE